MKPSRPATSRGVAASLPLVVLAAVLSARTSALGEEARKPNVVFFLADDLGWTDLGCYGSSFYETPNIDGLAASGMRFTEAYAACQVCSPTRASILSGKYPGRLDTTDYFGGARRGKLLPAPYIRRLPLEEVTIAEALKEAGYRTFHIGKWHLGQAPYLPENQGFDVNVAGHGAGMPASYYFPYKRGQNSRFAVPGLAAGGREGEYLTDRLGREACRLIESAGEEPFFLYFPFYSVHTPLQAKKEYAARHRERAEKLPKSTHPEFVPEGRRLARQEQNHAVYAGMVQSLDDNVGRVLKKIDELGLAEHTAIFFMSDNGGLSTSEGSPTSNLPLRAGKGWMYEGGIREPLIVRWPGVTKSGSVCHTPVISTDFYPTILEIASLPPRPTQHLDGVSLAPLLRGDGALEPRDLFWHYPHYGNQGGRPCGAIRRGQFKLVEFFEDGRLELYDLRHDIGERKNILASRPQLAAEMHARLGSWRREVDAKMPSPNPRWKPRPPRVLLIGDSISMGYTEPVKKLLARKADVVRIPTNGATTHRGLERLDVWVGNGKWDLIHFNWGLHDLCFKEPVRTGRKNKQSGEVASTLEQYAVNLETLVVRLRATGAKLIWASTTPVREGEPGRYAGDAKRYNAIARPIMERHGVAIDDLWSAVHPRLKELQRPGGDVHFRPEGQAFLARVVARSIARELGIEVAGLDPATE